MSDDTEFMADLEAATRSKPSFSSNLMLISITAFVVLGTGWAGFSKIEEITRGAGQVVPTSEIQVVQSLEGGVLAELMVAEGDVVEKGQILMRVSDVQSSSEEKGSVAKSLGLRAKRARLYAEANGKSLSLPAEITKSAPDVARNEEALYRSRQQELANARNILDNKISRANSEMSEIDAKIVRLKDSRKLLEDELAITKEMVKKKAVPQLEEIRLNREVGDIGGQIREAEERKGGLAAEVRGARQERADQEDKFRSQALGELNDVETQISQIDQSLTATRDRVSRAEIRSPVKGAVNKVTIKTVGGVIEPAMKLVEIVPVDKELKIVARVAPGDIAFLHPGQDVKVKITAYNPQKYGSLNGKLTRIGANSVTDNEGNAFFEIEVKTEKGYLGDEASPLPITPGMVAETEVITGKRTVLEYILKPILRVKDRALTER